MPDESLLNFCETLAIEEYKYCRNSVAKSIDTMEKNEVYVIGAIGATTAFCLSSFHESIAISAAFINLILCALGFLRHLMIDRDIILTQRYIKEIEDRFQNIQYTTFHKREGTESLRFSRRVAWCVLIVSTCGFFLYAVDKAPFNKPSTSNCVESASPHTKNSN